MKKKMQSTVWQCDQILAGAVYERKLFETREDAESFASQLGRVVPDLLFDIRSVALDQVWN